MPGSDAAGHFLSGFRILGFLFQMAEIPETGDAANQEDKDNQKAEDDRDYWQGDKNRSRAVSSADLATD